MDQSHLIHYVPQESVEEDVETRGLMSATLGLSFTVEPWHFQTQGAKGRRTSISTNPNSLVIENEMGAGGISEQVVVRHSGQRELWVKCEASMPPLEGTVYPYTREVFLGSYVDSFNRFESRSSSSSAPVVMFYGLALWNLLVAVTALF